ncbi:hypothetical protein ACWEQL_07045 [Kitasatospora sp. NPDC004240]
MSGPGVAIVTSAAGLAYDEDLPLIVDALRARGVAAEAVAWDDAGAPLALRHFAATVAARAGVRS